MSLLLLALLSGAPTPNCPDPSLRNYDVIVVGAGSSGITAAIQAARRPDIAVALLEETNQIGGQIVAAGVTTIDGGLNAPVSISGLYADYRTRVHQFYASIPMSQNACLDQSPENTCTEPRVARATLQAMLDLPVGTGSTLCVFTNEKVVGVTKSGNRVTGVTTVSAGFPVTWQSHVVIDATEYGDVIPMTGAVYRIGRKLSNDPYVSVDNCIDDITQTAVVRQYRPPLPPSLHMPPVLADQTLSNQFHTLVGEGLWADVCPADSFWSWSPHQYYRGLPDTAPDRPEVPPLGLSRSGVNYANDYPGYYRYCPGATVDYVWRGRLPIDFLENPAFRQNAICEARLLTLKFLHYMQRPDQLMQYGSWSIANDEGYDTPNACSFPPAVADLEKLLPPIPYVRESRRILSVVSLSGADIRRPSPGAPATNRMRTALALGDHSSDQHNRNCRSHLIPPEPGEDLANTTDYKGAFQIPFLTFIPQVIDGFLPAEKNLGYTRLASAAARVQPSTMLVGQAAGAIAGLAAKGYNPPRQPRAVRVLDVQKELLTWRAATSLDTFSDVPVGHARWADAQIVSTYDIMTFDSLTTPGWYVFRVADGATRAVAAAAVVRAFRIPLAPEVDPGFVDVPDGYPDFKEVWALAREGFDTRCPPNGPEYFCPQDAVTRERLAQWIAQARWGTSVPPPPPGQQTFSDVPPAHPFYQVIEAVAGEGLMFECGTSPLPGPHVFCPGDSAKRGELAQSMAQVLYKYPSIWP